MDGDSKEADSNASMKSSQKGSNSNQLYKYAIKNHIMSNTMSEEQKQILEMKTSLME